MRSKGAFAFCLCFVLPALAVAQQTGAISGVVKGSDGLVVPGAGVEARSNVLPAPRVTTTGNAGEYRLPALPPGRYTVTFTLSGMTTVTKQVDVQLAQDTAADVTMSVAGVTEDVTVVATAPIIETNSSELKGGVSFDTIKSLPVGQDYRDLLKLIPGVQYSPDSTRPQRRRQRPGQHLQVRRCQRHDATLRYADERRGVAGHRAGHHGQGRREGG